MLIPSFRVAIAFALFALPGLALAQPAGGTQPPAGSQQPPAGQPGAQPAAPGAGSGQLQSFEDKLSYAVGLNAGRMLQRQGLNPDHDLFIQGFKDSYKEGAALLSDQEIEQIFAKVQQEMRAKAEEAQKQMMAKWDESFSQASAESQKTASGLSYTVIEQGQGPKPKEDDYVVVHYVGKFPSGEVFDSSLKRGEPAVFQLGPGKVIDGWNEGMQLMAKGAKYRFEVPAELGYGEEGFGERIPADQDLIFEVHLLDVKPPPAAQGAPAGAGGAAGGNRAGGAAGSRGGSAAGGERAGSAGAAAGGSRAGGSRLPQ